MVACDDDDDDDDDVRDQAIGNYSATLDCGYIYENTFYKLTDLATALGAEVEDLSTTMSATLEKTNSGLQLKAGDKDEQETFVFNKIAQASNGFGFDVADFVMDLGEDGKFTWKGYNGARLDDVKYNGFYLSEDKTLEFYLYDEDGKFEDFMWADLTEEDFASIVVMNTKVADIFSDGKLVMKFVCTKK